MTRLLMIPTSRRVHKVSRRYCHRHFAAPTAFYLATSSIYLAIAVHPRQGIRRCAWTRAPECKDYVDESHWEMPLVAGRGASVVVAYDAIALYGFARELAD
ncbi:uncharacterized protein C8Q71DRAFT_722514 [Rhodofomes roseus]|uniref:Uncharacterized protein n=1 Tax=Rhodofomes roseus TaxID=34475 RepID=A0ABQ8KJM5_9APHY|nr:uncharacterized protein C8Q71DRAFT_722514 [Rhodofomes roseus]KAH9838291.1 hypothetical protein C8Q71DRAFT_722514 [Rhodofomes roseus]